MKKMNFYKYFLIALLGANFSPAFSQEEKTISPSKIDLTVSLEKSYIENLINSELPTTISDSGSGNQLVDGKNNLLSTGLKFLGQLDSKYAGYTEKFMWNYSIVRGPVAFNAQGQDIEVKGPFQGAITAQWVNSTEGAEAQLKGIAGIKSRVVIDQNWNLISSTTPILNLENAQLPLNLNLYGIKLNTNIDINSALEGKVSSALQKVTKKLDDEVKNFDFRKIAEEQWLKLKEPMLLNPEYNIWLTAAPLEARYSNIVSTDSTLGIKIGSDVNLKVYVGKKPNFNLSGSIPKINYGNVTDQFDIVLPVTSDYETLNRILQEKISGKTYTPAKFVQVVPSLLTVSGEDQKLTLDGNINLSILSIFNPKARVKAVFTPIFDSEKGVLSAKEFEYSLETDSWLLKFLDKILHNKITESVKNSIDQLDIQKDIQSAAPLIQSKVGKIQLGNNAVLENNINNFNILGMEISENNITIICNLRGNSTLKVK